MKTMKHLCIANEGILMNLGSKFQGIFLFSMGLALLLHIRMNPSFQSIEGLPLISIASIENFERMTHHTDPYRTLYASSSMHQIEGPCIPVSSSQEVSCAFLKLSGCLIHMVLTSASVTQNTESCPSKCLGCVQTIFER